MWRPLDRLMSIADFSVIEIRVMSSALTPRLQKILVAEAGDPDLAGALERTMQMAKFLCRVGIIAVLWV
jgi:hypothetical protein